MGIFLRDYQKTVQAIIFLKKLTETVQSFYVID